ncbi:hypothetical protein [Rothia nasimurium]|uniref:hypothetical protein n=1 Tax=Rothia nasimurium TaxID=85336 RepID=UPI0014321EBF|nr:hypothetical protein [Rothia nasimurium]MBF0808251.1 hypothetical protein [Rothia nasimurium]
MSSPHSGAGVGGLGIAEDIVYSGVGLGAGVAALLAEDGAERAGIKASCGQGSERGAFTTGQMDSGGDGL